MAQINKLSIVILIETCLIFLFLFYWWPINAYGFVIGSVMMVANLQILARGWSGIILRNERITLALVSSIVSFIFLGVVAFVVYRCFSDALIGFACGVFSLPVVVVLTALFFEHGSFAHQKMSP